MASPLVKRYLLALDRYRWAGIAVALAVMGGAGVFAVTQKPPEVEYTAEGVLVQNAPLLTFTATGSELQEVGKGIVGSKEFLLAEPLLQQVSDQLAARNIGIKSRDIRNNITLKSDEGGQILVQFTWPDQEESEAALTLLFEGMVELSRFTNKARLTAIIDELNKRLPQAESELRKAEYWLESYDRTEGPALQSALDGSLLGGISGSQNQRRQNLITLAGLDAQMKSLQSQLGMTPEQAYASSALSADPIIANLRAQIYQTETQIQLQSRDLRPAHPTMVQLNKDLDSYEQLLRERAAEVIGGEAGAPLPSGYSVRQDSSLDPARAQLANQLVALETQRKSLLQQQQLLAQSELQMRQQYASLPNKQLERNRLAQQVALKQALYDQIQAKRIDAQAAEAETVSSLSIAKPPSSSLVPQKEPMNPIVVLLAGAVVGLVAGGAVVFLLDMLDGTVRTTEDLEGLFRDQDVPVLGLVPDVPTRARRLKPVLLQSDSPYGDIFERLRSNLRLIGAQALEGKVPQVVLVTSTQAHEGKTVTAQNLAIAFARAGRRTLLIEADLRSPSEADRVNVTPDVEAVVEPLRYYEGKVSEPISLVPDVENFYISPSPGPQRNAAAIIESSEMHRLLKDAKARFDMVILDAPALSRCNDAMLLQSQTDGVILVARPGVTEKAVLITALQQLEEAEEVNVLGAIINGADVPITVAKAAKTKKKAEIPLEDLEADEEEPAYAEVPISRIDF